MNVRVLTILLALVVLCKSKCEDPDRFPGFAITADSDTQVDVEVDPAGIPITIKKRNNCYYSVYDVALQTIYLEDTSGSYSSKFLQSNHFLTENQHVSEWFEWERETQVGQKSQYTARSNMLNYYVSGSILALYVFIALLACSISVITRLCCKSKRSSSVVIGSNKPPVEKAIQHRDDDVYGAKGKDLFEFEMAASAEETKWLENAQNQKLGLKGQPPKTFSKTLFVEKENYGSMEDLTRPAADNDSVQPGSRERMKMNRERIQQLQGIMKRSLTQNEDFNTEGYLPKEPTRNHSPMMDYIDNGSVTNIGSQQNLHSNSEFEEERMRSVRHSIAVSLKNDVIASYDTTAKPMSKFGLRNARKRKIMHRDQF